MLSPGQLAYAAADAVLCRRLWTKVAAELKAKDRDTAYRLQRDCLPAAAAMQLRGVAIDLDAHAAPNERQPPPGTPTGAASYLEKILPEGSLSRGRAPA